MRLRLSLRSERSLFMAGRLRTLVRFADIQQAFTGFFIPGWMDALCSIVLTGDKPAHIIRHS